MRIINEQIHFSRYELKELAQHNPTLFEVAEAVAKLYEKPMFEAHLTYGGSSVIVHMADDEGRLLCPSQLFFIKNACRDDCSKYRCWATSSVPDKYGHTPCWYGRRWNDFVAAVSPVAIGEDIVEEVE